MNTDKRSEILSVFKLAILLSFLTCADTPNKPIPSKELFGWEGAPEDITKKPYDYFYAKFYGKVEILSTKLKAEDYQNKCIESATKQAKEEMFLVVVDLSIQVINDGPEPWEHWDLLQLAVKHKKDFSMQLLNCKPIAYPFSGMYSRIEGSKWRDCECIFYMKVPGGRDAIVAKSKTFEWNEIP